jgi:hypothetical protein
MVMDNGRQYIGEGVKKNISGFEGSQALPIRPSDRGDAHDAGRAAMQ